MEMMYYEPGSSSYQESINILQAHIQHANSLAAAIPRAKGGARLQMNLVYNQFAPIFLFLLQWMDCSFSYLLPRYLNLFHIDIYKVYKDGRPTISRRKRKASVSDFYAIILPSLQRLHCDLVELKGPESEKPNLKSLSKKQIEGHDSFSDLDMERDSECGICLEPCTKMVLPNCCHAMCINCYRDWNARSESCPFCRGNIKRVKSRELWVLMCEDEVVDPEEASQDDLQHFYLYINSLPKDSPDELFLKYYEYLI